VLDAVVVAQVCLVVYLAVPLLTMHHDPGSRWAVVFGSAFASPVYLAFALWLATLGVALAAVHRRQGLPRLERWLWLAPGLTVLLCVGWLAALARLSSELASNSAQLFGTSASGQQFFSVALVAPVLAFALTFGGLQFGVLSALRTVRTIEAQPSPDAATRWRWLAMAVGVALVSWLLPELRWRSPLPSVLLLLAASAVVLVGLAARGPACLAKALDVALIAGAGTLSVAVGARISMFGDLDSTRLDVDGLEAMAREWIQDDQFETRGVLLALPPLVLLAGSWLYYWWQAPERTPVSARHLLRRALPVLGWLTLGLAPWIGAEAVKRQRIATLTAALSPALPEDIELAPVDSALSMGASPGPSFMVGRVRSGFEHQEQWPTLRFGGAELPNLGPFEAAVAQVLTPTLFVDRQLPLPMLGGVLSAVEQAGFVQAQFAVGSQTSLELPEPFDRLALPRRTLPVLLVASGERAERAAEVDASVLLTPSELALTRGDRCARVARSSEGFAGMHRHFGLYPPADVPIRVETGVQVVMVAADRRLLAGDLVAALSQLSAARATLLEVTPVAESESERRLAACGGQSPGLR
jgi:hypothetical protein